MPKSFEPHNESFHGELLGTILAPQHNCVYLRTYILMQNHTQIIPPPTCESHNFYFKLGPFFRSCVCVCVCANTHLFHISSIHIVNGQIHKRTRIRTHTLEHEHNSERIVCVSVSVHYVFFCVAGAYFACFALAARFV